MTKSHDNLVRSLYVEKALFFMEFIHFDHVIYYGLFGVWEKNQSFNKSLENENKYLLSIHKWIGKELGICKSNNLPTSYLVVA